MNREDRDYDESFDLETPEPVICRHIWDIHARIKYEGGASGIPCTRCDAVKIIPKRKGKR